MTMPISWSQLIACMPGRAHRQAVYLAALTILFPCLLFGQPPRSATSNSPKVDHILLEVGDLQKSIAFYRDLMGLQLKMKLGGFATLESGNIGVFLWNKRWDWETSRAKGERQGLGMYPHFKVNNVSAVVEAARKAGYSIIQEPRHYLWGTEAFIADPDGYIWAIIS